jgi:hypothetical protein
MELRWFIKKDGTKVLQFLRDGVWVNVTTERE